MVFRLTVACGRLMEGVGFTATRTTIGMPLLMPPSIPPDLLVRRLDLILLQDNGVVILRAAQFRRAEPRPELHSLYGGDGEKRFRQVTLQRIENRLAQPGGNVRPCLL